MPYPRAAQVARLARHVGQRPLEIVCLAPSGNHTIQIKDSDGIDLIRIPRSFPIRILERLLGARRARALQEYDVKYLWWRIAARRISALKITSDDVLVSFGQPMVDHLAGLLIKQRTGVRWIAHFSDPWAGNPFDPNASAEQRNELRVLEAADLAVFTSAETVDLVYAGYHSALRAKARVLPHAFDPSLYPSAQPSNAGICVRYVGNLFPGRGPEPLFQALSLISEQSPSALHDVRFEFIGDVAAAFKELPLLNSLPSGCVTFRSRVPYQESLSLMSSSDLLLNIDAPAEQSVFLPSKLVDYVGSGKPILSVSPPGASASLVSSLGGWVANPLQPDEIASQLMKALTFVKDRPVQWGSAAVRAQYEATTVAARFEQMIAELMLGDHSEFRLGEAT